jgi:uncharacterized alpha-E superfamily protein
MLARVADSICWMSRYMQRSAMMLTALRTHYIASQDGLTEINWRQVANLYGGSAPPWKDAMPQPRQALHWLLFNKENDNALINNITSSRENARSVQDHITKEVWQCLNNCYHLVRDLELEKDIIAGDPVSVVDLLLHGIMHYNGTVDTTMPRGEGFNYLNIGRFMERALQCSNLLYWQLQETPDDERDGLEPPDWRYLLYSLSGYELYLKTYRGAISQRNVVQQVIYNTQFSHSILYCLNQVQRYYERLAADSVPEHYEQLGFLIGRAINEVRYTNIHDHPKQEQLQFIRRVQQLTISIAEGFNEHYFGVSS